MVKITVDSGNNVCNGVAIKDDFRKRIGARFCSIRKNVIQTASTENLTQVGECMVNIKLRGCPKIVAKANVLKELKDDINLGMAFFQQLANRNKTSLEFTKDGTILKHGKAEIELVQQVQEQIPEAYQQFEFKLRASEAVEIAPRSMKFIGTDKRVPGK